ncbi:hypothetical protein BDB01DRAFT_897944 [Pilobolus umbonatus]|nr:hypothetical protein BDB01DRAFT_897944 [Pilobolus umbonatus]
MGDMINLKRYGRIARYSEEPRLLHMWNQSTIRRYCRWNHKITLVHNRYWHIRPSSNQLGLHVLFCEGMLAKRLVTFSFHEYREPDYHTSTLDMTTGYFHLIINSCIEQMYLSATSHGGSMKQVESSKNNTLNASSLLLDCRVFLLLWYWIALGDGVTDTLRMFYYRRRMDNDIITHKIQLSQISSCQDKVKIALPNE